MRSDEWEIFPIPSIGNNPAFQDPQKIMQKPLYLKLNATKGTWS